MEMHERSDPFELFGLNPSEKKIILAISKLGKSVAMISRHAGIPRTSILYILKKLQKKSYVWSTIVGKRKFWRSNIPQITEWMANVDKKMKKT